MRQSENTLAYHFRSDLGGILQRGQFTCIRQKRNQLAVWILCDILSSARHEFGARPCSDRLVFI